MKFSAIGPLTADGQTRRECSFLILSDCLSLG
jgi:hypothetical protein